MTFWITALVLSIAVAAIVLRPLLRQQKSGAVASSAKFGLQVYRDQLTEVDRDLAKSVLNEDEAARTRLEISRRILDADKEVSAENQAARSGRTTKLVAAALGAAVLLAGTYGIYRTLGANGAPDFPLQKRLAAIDAARDARPSQAEAEVQVGTPPSTTATPEYVALVEELRSKAVDRPDDLRGQRLLTQHEARIGNFIGARIAQGNVVRLLGDDVTGEDFIDLAELMIIAANGFVSPQAEQALGNAIQMAPQDPRGRYYSGLSLVQSGRPDIAYKLWNQLLVEGPDDAPWIAPIVSQIRTVAQQAGLGDVQLPRTASAALPGPDAQQIEDAQNLSAEDRNDFIRSMVSQLSERLATEGGNADEWARLIRALGVLGETARASAIWNEAKNTFAADPIAIATLLDAARSAEISN